MRWASLCAVLSTALLPAANARPLCRPDRGTSSKLAETTATSTAESAYATASVIRSTVTATASATTTDTYSQSTKTESATTSGFATLVSTTATASETLTTAESTTITEGASSTTTTTEAPEPTLINLVQNGDFEDDVNTDWSLRTADIVNDAEKANSPSHYVRLSVEEGMATGGNQVNQTINGLDTSHLFRLSFSSAVFDEPALNIGEAHCDLEGLQQGTVFERWPLDYSSLNEYMSYSAEFKPSDEDITLSFRLRCSTENVVTLAVGIDDVILNDLGVAPVEN
ncbi:hypothetical protein SUNI508_11082 [Seiridium unicorne]|uniref:Uncharacterized protein n=1 Tax=Seiridium unicorne TaxID=138068 RepID=A0ABR2UJU5_9PEZI